MWKVKEIARWVREMTEWYRMWGRTDSSNSVRFTAETIYVSNAVREERCEFEHHARDAAEFRRTGLRRIEHVLEELSFWSVSTTQAGQLSHFRCLSHSLTLTLTLSHSSDTRTHIHTHSLKSKEFSLNGICIASATSYSIFPSSPWAAVSLAACAIWNGDREMPDMTRDEQELKKNGVTSMW